MHPIANSILMAHVRITLAMICTMFFFVVAVAGLMSHLKYKGIYYLYLLLIKIILFFQCHFITFQSMINFFTYFLYSFSFIHEKGK